MVTPTHLASKNSVDRLMSEVDMPRWFQYVGRLEGASFLLLLFLAMPLKYYAHWPVLVKIMGPLHGALFLAYCALALMVGANEEWSFKKQVLALLAAVLPGGTFVFERKFAVSAKPVA